MTVPTKVWAAGFLLWCVFLSGAFADVIGSPGVLQAVRLRSLLSIREADLKTHDSEISRLSAEAALLERSAAHQRREIRRVLGYVAPDELVFDFTSTESAAGGPY